ncbi:MAG: hypothetical protein ABL917_01345 [Parcubacteria group bacterium]
MSNQKNRRVVTLLVFTMYVALVGIMVIMTIQIFNRELLGGQVAEEMTTLTDTVTRVRRGERVDVEKMNLVRFRLNNDYLVNRLIHSGTEDFVNSLKAAGVTDKQIEVLKSGKYRISLEP